MESVNEPRFSTQLSSAPDDEDVEFGVGVVVGVG